MDLYGRFGFSRCCLGAGPTDLGIGAVKALIPWGPQQKVCKESPSGQVMRNWGRKGA